ncbi:MAG: methyltransferase domain-containing protein, partial [Deltaproteobacteria bacterium]|nr:methyltransferase domain-containing protein [Deltaproteobacteria bacterium]
NVTTLDITHNLRPDVAGSVLAIPFKDGFFDVVACYEVLEHVPYRNFAGALKELGRVSCRHVILSFPDVTSVYRLNIELPRIKEIKKLIPHPFPQATVHVFDGEHYWEIGKTDYPLKKIKLDIKRAGLRIRKTYRVFESYYHRLFLLEAK